jgi:hypothetical protein
MNYVTRLAMVAAGTALILDLREPLVAYGCLDNQDGTTSLNRMSPHAIL